MEMVVIGGVGGGDGDESDGDVEFVDVGDDGYGDGCIGGDGPCDGGDDGDYDDGGGDDGGDIGGQDVS
ncbi:hypothetical protein DPMN_192918 [Dreissena polymorpha]|uniref:Uncharacterized protein n=1 Tax=Dreissena polymorpha TaxID=45954 RepID=A0A9D4BDQ2_DREPO|nr:hypothetical protein DPMN_192918 [Dreissena polymorpha]